MRVIFVLDIYCQLIKLAPSAMYMMVVANENFSCDNRFLAQVGVNLGVLLDPTIYQVLLLVAVKLFAELENPR